VGWENWVVCEWEHTGVVAHRLHDQCGDVCVYCTGYITGVVAHRLHDQCGDVCVYCTGYITGVGVVSRVTPVT